MKPSDIKKLWADYVKLKAENEKLKERIKHLESLLPPSGMDASIEVRASWEEK